MGQRGPPRHRAPARVVAEVGKVQPHPHQPPHPHPPGGERHYLGGGEQIVVVTVTSHLSGERGMKTEGGGHNKLINSLIYLRVAASKQTNCYIELLLY